FQLPSSAFAALPQRLGETIRRLGERLLSFPALNALYRETRGMPAELPFCERGLRVLHAQIDIAAEGLARIPTRGPLIVVANHPFGGLDGLVLGALLQRVRPDARLLVNFLLHTIPDMREVCFFVDPFGGSGAAARNIGGMKAALRWVR